MVMLTRWLHTCSPVPVFGEGRNKQLGTRVRTGAPRLSQPCLSPQKLLVELQLLILKHRCSATPRSAVLNSLVGALPGGKYIAKGNICRRQVLAGTKLVLWDKWQVWWLEGCLPGTPDGSFLLPCWGWWLQRWPAQARGPEQAKQEGPGCSWAAAAIPPASSPGKRCSRKLSNPHLSCSGLSHGANPPFFLCNHRCPLWNGGFPLATQRH